MSWSAPNCHHCHACSSTRFDDLVAYGPSFVFTVCWDCQACHARTIELCTIGPDALPPEGCLSCGASRVNPSGQLDDCCGECGAEHQQLVARVREHCEVSPRIDKIRALRGRGLYRVAFNALLLRLQTNPNDVEALQTRAKLLIDVHRPEQAVPLLRRVLSLGGLGDGEAEAQIDLGVALAESGQHREAASVYESFLVIYPTHDARGVVLSNLGGCLSALGHSREAENYHRQAILADPDHLGPRWNLFANLHAQGRHADALRVLEDAIELPTLEAAARELMQAHRVELLMALGRYTDAFTAIDASLFGEPNKFDLRPNPETLGSWRRWVIPVGVTVLRAHELLTLNLRRLTEQSHMPLTVVADRAGIDRRELFAVMAGEQEADLDWLFKLADGLGVRASELLREPEDDK